MAWNGSDKTASQQVPRKQAAKQSNAVLRGILAGGIVVVLASAALYFLMRTPEKEEPISAEKPSVNSRIAEAKPAVVTNRPSEKIVEKKPADRWYKFHGNEKCPTYIDENGIERYRGGARVYRPDMKMHKVKTNVKPAIFRNRAENQIYALLTTDPGATVFGTRHFGKDFRDSFTQSLIDKTVINDDDPPEVKQAKEMVDKAKKELFERVKAGEDVCQIMQDAYDELNRMASQKRTIERELAHMAQEGKFDDTDAKAMIDAVNKNLAKKGISPVSCSFLMKQNLKRSFEAKKGKMK